MSGVLQLEMINTLSKITGEKPLYKKTVAFLYTNNKHVEKDIMETVSPKIV